MVGLFGKHLSHEHPIHEIAQSKRGKTPPGGYLTCKQVL